MPLVALIGAVVLVYAFPLADYALKVGDSWQGIVPAHIEDAQYYYARMHEVVEGRIFFGNPLYREHENAIAPSWGIAEHFAAVPLALTGSWTFTIIFNIFFWALASALLIYATFRLLGLSRLGSAFGAFFVSLQLVLLTTRPVSMQVPYASLFLFVYLLVLWMQRGGYRSAVFLGLSSVAALMTYTFTGQTVFFTLASVGIGYLFAKRWDRVFELIVSAAVSLPLFALYAWIVFIGLSDPFYAETLVRFGFVKTHFPMIDVYYYGRWLACMGVAFGFLWYSGGISATDYLKVRLSLALIFGIGMSLLAPILVGRDIESAVHIGRLVFPIAAFMLILFLSVALAHPKKNSPFFILAVLVSLLVFMATVKNVYNRNIITVPPVETLREIQSYASVLEFIHENGSDSVVWTPDNLVPYVPMYTSAKVLFAHQGGLYTLPTEEQHERYLVSRFPQGNTVTELIRNVGLYDNVAPKSFEEFELRIRLCSFNRTCEKVGLYSDHKGQSYFELLQAKYEHDIVPHIESYLDKYQVRYILLLGTEKLPTEIAAKAVYTDSKYSLYERE